mmetsp:Transcript_39336/g.113588  ORF Transcript_39336/g.113588 Transcript_39336/m.113588 type:complete len:228 (-) Transcript_39336:476-1159(-)
MQKLGERPRQQIFFPAVAFPRSLRPSGAPAASARRQAPQRLQAHVRPARLPVVRQQAVALVALTSRLRPHIQGPVRKVRVLPLEVPAHAREPPPVVLRPGVSPKLGEPHGAEALVHAETPLRVHCIREPRLLQLAVQSTRHHVIDGLQHCASDALPKERLRTPKARSTPCVAVQCEDNTVPGDSPCLPWRQRGQHLSQAALGPADPLHDDEPCPICHQGACAVPCCA